MNSALQVEPLGCVWHSCRGGLQVVGVWGQSWGHKGSGWKLGPRKSSSTYPWSSLEHQYLLPLLAPCFPFPLLCHHVLPSPNMLPSSLLHHPPLLSVPTLVISLLFCASFTRALLCAVPQQRATAHRVLPQKLLPGGAQLLQPTGHEGGDCRGLCRPGEAGMVRPPPLHHAECVQGGTRLWAAPYPPLLDSHSSSSDGPAHFLRPRSATLHPSSWAISSMTHRSYCHSSWMDCMRTSIVSRRRNMWSCVMLLGGQIR